MVSRATEAFLEPQCPVYLQEPSSNPSANEAGEAADIVVFEDLGHNAMETMTAAGNEPVSLFNSSLEYITKEIDDFYSLCEEMDVRPLPLEDSFIIVDGSNFEVPSSPQPPPPGATTNNAADTSSALVDGSRATSFMAWTRSSQSCSDEAVAVPVIEEPQELLKKVVAGSRATRSNCGGGGGTTGTAQEISGIKNHVISERKRREKLNEMFLILKSLVPSIHKAMKISAINFFILP